ncbi:MAG TPA: DUF1161 domain-containing protein [Rhodocyclaceae bacterium]
MKRVLLAFAVSLLAMPAFAQIKPCEELKAEIAAKIEANGVTTYQLEIIPIDQETDWKVVGTCDGQTKKIVYRRG